MSDMTTLDLSRPRPDVTVITLNRPEKLNALSYELVEDLHGAIDGIVADNECRVVVLTGAGRGFCSGLDLTAPNPPEAAGGTEFPARGCAGRSGSPSSLRGCTGCANQ